LGNVFCGEQFVGSRVKDNAIAAAHRLDDDKANSGGCVDGLSYVRDVNSLVAAEAQRHFTESIASDSGDEADLRPEPGATHRLIGTFTAIVHTVTCSQERLARAWQAINLHGQSGRVTTDNSDSMLAQ
jgi:hypothetical protein